MVSIALIEDDVSTSDSYRDTLVSAGYSVAQYFTKDDAIVGITQRTFSAWILDIRLGADYVAGISMIKLAIERGLSVPILVISGAAAAEVWRPVTLELGVWDYLEKPIDPPTLVAKVRRLIDTADRLRAADDVRIPDLVFNASDPRKVQWMGHRISLPLTAWSFLKLLVSRPGKTVTYEAFYKEVVTGHTKDNVRAHIRILKDEFRAFDPNFDRIVPVPGQGYKWNEEQPHAEKERSVK